MSKATKSKHVRKEVLNEFILPRNSQEIVKILSGRGNNLHEVQKSNGETNLASMPSKFRNSVWIKRGDFVIAEPIEEGDKVKLEIKYILYQDQIDYIHQEGLWPKEFIEVAKSKNDQMIPDEMLPPSDDSDSDQIIMGNPNRPVMIKSDSSDSSDDDSDND